MGAKPPEVLFPGMLATGLIVADFPAWLWVAPVYTPELFEDANFFEALLRQSRNGEEVRGFLYLPENPDITEEALAYLEFITVIPRLVAEKLGYGQIATISHLGRAQLRVAVERTLLG